MSETNVFEDIDPRYRKQKAEQLKRLKERAIRQAIKNSSTLTRISKKAIRKAEDLGKRNKITENTKEKIRQLAKKSGNIDLGKKLSKQRAIFKKFDLPIPKAPSRITFRPAQTRVNVLSDYGNDKFYPRRKIPRRETYLGNALR